MRDQNYKNHAQLVPLYHGFTLLALLALVTGSIRNLIICTDENRYDAALILLASVVISLLYYFTRAFALKAQDRAIRAEEKLRYFILTGKMMSQDLSTRQIIALRFASDEEFPSLAQKALDEKLSPKDIKKSIRQWRGDYYRV